MLTLGAKYGVSDPFYVGAFSLLPQQTIGRLGASSSYEAAAVRLLLGTADVLDSSGGLVLKQRRNYFVLGCPKVRSKSERGVRRELAKVDLAWREVDRHLRRTLIHQGYFRAVASELVEYFVRSKQGAHTLAFLHMYRLLERISFVFPLLFAVRSSQYTGAFSTLREFFKGGTESELALLRKFQESSIDSSNKNASTLLDFGGIGAGFADSSYKVAKRCVPDEDVISGTSPQLEIKSQALLSLLINVRNFYFHSSVSNASNISIAELGDSDNFFTVINRPILNWLGTLYLAVLIERIK